MGSGKTHWGKIWAEMNGFIFIDLDAEIEKEVGKSIAAIFENKGEPYFREIEAATLRTFAGAQNTIVACGGGTPCFYENIKWMNEQGTTIVMVTHSEHDARYSHRVIRMLDGQTVTENILV